MEIPHLLHGGSPKEFLMEDIATARESLRTAGLDLQMTAPNARDYLHQDANFTLATAEFSERRAALAKIYKELGELAEAIDAQTT